MTSNVVALLPMKLHSERVKGKNFKRLVDKPLFRWILDALLAVDEIDKVVINTDAKDTLKAFEIGSSDRVVIRQRKPELCGDNVSMNLILADDIAAVPAHCYIMTHTTNPLITSATIGAGLQQFLRDSEHDSLFSVNKVQTRFYRQDGSPVNHDPDNLIRTQDLITWFEENSCLYYFSVDSFLKTRARIGQKPAMFITPPLESVDIDEPHDWIMAEALAQQGVKNV